MEKKFKISLLAASVVMGLSLAVTNVTAAEQTVSEKLAADLSGLTNPAAASGGAKNYSDALETYSGAGSTDSEQYKAFITKNAVLGNALYDYYAKQQEQLAVENAAAKYLADVYGSSISGNPAFATVHNLNSYYSADGTINSTVLSAADAKDSLYAKLIKAATDTTGRTVGDVTDVKGLTPAIDDLIAAAKVAAPAETDLANKVDYYSALIKEELKIDALRHIADADKIKLDQAAKGVVQYIAEQSKDAANTDNLKKAVQVYLAAPSATALEAFLADASVSAAITAGGVTEYNGYTAAKARYGKKGTAGSSLYNLDQAITKTIADFESGSTNANSSGIESEVLDAIVNSAGEILDYATAKVNFNTQLTALEAKAEEANNVAYQAELKKAKAAWQAYQQANENYLAAKGLADTFTTRLAVINTEQVALGTTFYNAYIDAHANPEPGSYALMISARDALTNGILDAAKRAGTFDSYKAQVVADYNSSLAEPAAGASKRDALISTQIEVAQAKLKALAYLSTIDDFGGVVERYSQDVDAITAQYNSSKATYQQAKAAYDAAFARPKLNDSVSTPVFISKADQAAYDLAKAGLQAAVLHLSGADKPELVSNFLSLLQLSGQAKDYDKLSGGLSARLDSYTGLPSAVRGLTGNTSPLGKHRLAVANSVQELNHGWRSQGLNQNTATGGFAAYQAAVNQLVAQSGPLSPYYGKTVEQITTERKALKHDRYLDQQLFLGALPASDSGIQFTDAHIPYYNGIVLNNENGNYQPKVSFSVAELAALNLSSKESPFRNTLNMQVADLNPTGDFSKNNEIVLGDSKDSASLWFTAKDVDISADPKMITRDSTALKISGELLDSNFAVIGADGSATLLAPHTAGKANAYDKITLQNLNINMVESASQLEQERLRRVADLQAEIASMKSDGSTAAEIAKYTTTQQGNIDTWLSKMSLNVDQYLTGLEITASTKTQVLGGATDGTVSQDNDVFRTVAVDQIKGVADTSVPQNIVLNHVNINVQNDTGKYINIFDVRTLAKATAIKVSGNGDHLQISNSNIEAHTVPGGTETALVLDGYNNRADFSNSQIYGSIVDNHMELLAEGPKQNVVTLTDSNWTGDAFSHTTALYEGPNYSGKNNYLRLELTDSIWKGGSGESPDVILAGDKQGSTWDVLLKPGNGPADDTHGSSVNSLTFSGSGNILNLVPKVEQVRSGYQPVLVSGSPARENTDNLDRLAQLEVEHDLTLGANSVSTIIASAWAPPTAVGVVSVPYNYVLSQLKVDGLLVQQDPDVKKAGKLVLSLASHGAQPFETVDGKLADYPLDNGLLSGPRNTPHAFVVFKTDDRDTDVNVATSALSVVKSDQNAITGELVEAGVYQYQMVTEANENPQLPDYGYTSVFYQRNGHISNSAATAAAIASAPADVATMENDALDRHITSLRHSDSSGVWIAYYGGRNKNSLKAGSEYNLKTSGVILGADASFGDNWIAGVAFNSGKSNLSVLNSSGDVKGYGAQFWVSRHYSNGMFVNGDAQFGHYSNTLKASMLNGDQGRGDYATNGYGLTAKAGYSYQNDSGFYAEPYVKASARAFSGAAYNMTNDMTVNSTDYKSLVGELGADLGYTVPTNQGYIKPYLHLAVLDEFANRNHVRVNDIDLNNSIDGTAFRVGVGGEVKLMQNLGGYASFDYTKGSDIERPWQVNVGINYTW